jgi:hypothetical protein
VQLIGVTTTRAGLTVNTKLRKTEYPTKMKMTADEVARDEPRRAYIAWGMGLHHQVETATFAGRQPPGLARLAFPAFLADPHT